MNKQTNKQTNVISRIKVALQNMHTKKTKQTNKRNKTKQNKKSNKTQRTTSDKK